MKRGKQLLIDFIPILLIILFSYAAVSKLIDHENFYVQLGQSPLLTYFAPWLAWTMPIQELGVAVLLLIPKFRATGLYWSYTLMALFTIYIITILNFSSYIPCSCGGILEHMSWTTHLFFNIGFTILTIIAILLKPNINSITK